MPVPRLPAPLRDAAAALFGLSLALPESEPAAERQPFPGDAVAVGMGGKGRDTVADAAEAVIRAYLRFHAEESAAVLARFHAAGVALANLGLRLAPPPPLADEGGDDPEEVTPLGPELTLALRRWLVAWATFRRLWRAWHAPESPEAGTPARGGSPPAAAVLAADQGAVVEALVATFQSRRGAEAAGLPISMLPRWSVPLLVGPAGAGKAFVCAQAARRLDLTGCARWEVGAWNLVAARGSRPTLEQIEGYVADHPDALVHLAGVDTLSSARLGAGDVNVTYLTAVAAEVEGLLDRLTVRGDPPVDGDDDPRPAVVMSGRFAALWGETEVGGARGADLWRLADAEAPGGAETVGEWLREHSGLPAGLLRRTAAEPLVIRRLDSAEAARVADELCATLPPALDGALHAPELAGALAGPHGWRALAHAVERSLLTPT